jgi:hypothetical protein
MKRAVFCSFLVLLLMFSVFFSCHNLGDGGDGLDLDTDGDGIINWLDKCPGIPYQAEEVLFAPFADVLTNPSPADITTAVADPTSPTGVRVYMPPEDFKNLDMSGIEDLLASLGLPPDVIDEIIGMVTEILPVVLSENFNQLDGMSTTGDITIYLSAPPDPASINSRTVQVINIDSSSPHFLEPAPMDMVYETLSADTVNPEERYRITMRPADPLYSRTPYLVLVTNGLVTECEEIFEPSPDMEALMSKTAAGDTIEPYRLEYQAYLDLLEQGLGVSRDDISLLYLMTTQSVPEDLIAIRKDAKAAPIPPVTIKDYFPPLTDDGLVNWDGFGRWNGFNNADRGQSASGDTLGFPAIPDDIVIHSGYFTNIAMIVYGEFPSHSYLNNERIFQLDPATFKPIVFGDENLEFILALPQAAKNGPVPVVVFGHALGVCKETLIAIADTFARHGFATMGIDVLGHGSRSSDGNQCGANTDMVSMIGDLIYTNLSILPGGTIEVDINLLSIREIFRQSAADEVQFVQMIKKLTNQIDVMPVNGNTVGDGMLDLDTSHLGFCSQSLGSVIGGTLVGVEPDLEASVLNVGGGYFSEFVSVFLGEFMAFIPPEIFVGVQMVMDGADPINYMRAVTREPFPGLSGAKKRNLLLQEAVDDDTVPNKSTENLARVSYSHLVWPYVKEVPGLFISDAPVTGNLEPGVTAGLFQFYPAEHEFLLMPDDLYLTVAGQEQAAIFLSSALWDKNGASTIINTFYTAPPQYP